MRAGAGLIAAIIAILFAGSAAAAGAELIYRVDSARAAIVKHHLVISAQGAVRSGGWDHPRLRVIDAYVPEARTLAVEFLARPPAKRQAVIQALLPVSINTLIRLPRYGTTQVKIVGKTNSITVPITR